MSAAHGSESEEEILERIRGGDADVFLQYADSKRRSLQAFVSRKLSDAMKRKVEAQDIVQEVIISASNSFEQIDLSQRDPFGWLCHLAERRIIDAHRRFFGSQKRAAFREVGLDSPASDGERGGLLDLLIASMTSPSKAFSRGQREFRMLEAVNELTEDSRAALQLRYIEGLPSKEIAERLGKTDAAIRVLLTRSLNKLQKMLQNDTLFKSFAQNQDKEQPPKEELQ